MKIGPPQAMLPSLDALLLTQDELKAAKKQIRKMAYARWEAAGSPEDDALIYWREAELEWIEYYYVPDR